MTQYECGHESKIIIADGGALTIAAYLEWNETVGREGTQEKCWDCWCNERQAQSSKKIESKLSDTYEATELAYELIGEKKPQSSKEKVIDK